MIAGPVPGDDGSDVRAHRVLAGLDPARPLRGKQRPFGTWFRRLDTQWDRIGPNRAGPAFCRGQPNPRCDSPAVVAKNSWPRRRRAIV